MQGSTVTCPDRILQSRKVPNKHHLGTCLRVSCEWNMIQGSAGSD
jgi:hypothetical protein